MQNRPLIVGPNDKCVFYYLNRFHLNQIMEATIQSHEAFFVVLFGWHFFTQIVSQVKTIFNQGPCRIKKVILTQHFLKCSNNCSCL